MWMKYVAWSSRRLTIAVHTTVLRSAAIAASLSASVDVGPLLMRLAASLVAAAAATACLLPRHVRARALTAAAVGFARAQLAYRGGPLVVRGDGA